MSTLCNPNPPSSSTRNCVFERPCRVALRIRRRPPTGPYSMRNIQGWGLGFGVWVWGVGILETREPCTYKYIYVYIYICGSNCIYIYVVRNPRQSAESSVRSTATRAKLSNLNPLHALNPTASLTRNPEPQAENRVRNRQRGALRPIPSAALPPYRILPTLMNAQPRNFDPKR